MREKYDVYIDGKLEKKGLSEDEYFDLMEDYAEGFYTKGEPNPSSITFKIILED
jgi:predicted metal-binding transcription factor (methanogenesis marker protein 9)